MVEQPPPPPILCNAHLAGPALWFRQHNPPPFKRSSRLTRCCMLNQMRPARAVKDVVEWLPFVLSFENKRTFEKYSLLVGGLDLFHRLAQNHEFLNTIASKCFHVWPQFGYTASKWSPFRWYFCIRYKRPLRIRIILKLTSHESSPVQIRRSVRRAKSRRVDGVRSRYGPRFSFVRAFRCIRNCNPKFEEAVPLVSGGEVQVNFAVFSLDHVWSPHLPLRPWAARHWQNVATICYFAHIFGKAQQSISLHVKVTALIVYVRQKKVGNAQNRKKLVRTQAMIKEGGLG